jgi:hypothetical protein
MTTHRRRERVADDARAATLGHGFMDIDARFEASVERNEVLEEKGKRGKGREKE